MNTSHQANAVIFQAFIFDKYIYFIFLISNK